MKEELDFLDELLKEQVADAQIPFKEEYWDKMSAKLDNEDKNNKRGFPFWRGLSILLVLLGTGLGAYLVPKFLTKKSSAETEMAAKSFQVGEAEKIYSNHDASAFSKTDSSNKLNTNNLEQNNSSDNSVAVSSPKTEISSENVTAPQPVKHNQKPIVQAASRVAESKASTPKTAAIPLESLATVSDKVAAPTTNDVTNSEYPKIDKLSPQRKQPKHAKFVSTIGSSKPENPKKLETVKTKGQEGDILSKSDGLVVNPVTETIGSGRTLPSTGKKEFEVKEVRVEKNKPVIGFKQSNPRYVDHLESYVPRVDCTITMTLVPKDVENKQVNTIDSSNSLVTKNEELPQAKVPPMDFEKRLLLFATLGMNLNKGLKGNANDQQSWAVSPYLSLGFEKPLRSDLGISASLGFTYFNGLNMVKQDNFYTYSFGVDSTQQSLYSRKLFQFYLPLNVQYKILERHYIFGGIGMTYSFQTSGKLEESTYNTQVNLVASPNKYQTNTTMVSEYNKGFQTFDFFLQAGYSYNFMNRWSAQVMVQQGFMDISKNSYYNNNIRNNLTRVSVGLKFNLKRYGK